MQRENADCLPVDLETRKKLNDEVKVIEKCIHGNFWLCKASGG